MNKFAPPSNMEEAAEQLRSLGYDISPTESVVPLMWGIIISLAERLDTVEDFLDEVAGEATIDPSGS